MHRLLGEILDVLADLDSEESDRDTLRVEGERQLRDHVAELAAALIQEREAERAEALDDDKSPHEASLQTTMPKTGCIQAAKACLQVQPEVITTLWNELTHAHEDGPRNIAERFNASALARQHRDRGDAQYGERFLNQWSCSLRQCRTNLTEVEMANILLSIQRHKRPGPNGIPGIAYKMFAKHFVAPFPEAFEELQEQDAAIPASFGERIWKVIPKTRGANLLSQMRDLEMPNEHRKVLARAYAIVIDEEAAKTMTHIQQAFLRSRNISHANIALGEGYFSAVDKSEFRYWMLMDCTKGYNYLSWTWLWRILSRAGLPADVMLAVQRLVQHGSAVILIFRTHTCAPLALNSGLAQGCPLNCVLYVLAVDPFLEFLQSIDGVGLVIAFCDDWNAECLTADAPHAVQEAGGEFEMCSGQSFNRVKSKILPTRPLTSVETAIVLGKLPACPIVSRAKILGLWLGYDYRPAEVGQEVEARYYTRMALLRMLPTSFVTRIVLLNVFLRSLWSYVNRHVSIPIPIGKRVEGADMKFLSKVPYFALGLLSHVSQLYGVRVHLHDFELANIAGLISTAWLAEHGAAEAGRLLRESSQDRGNRGRLRPSTAFATAYGFCGFPGTLAQQFTGHCLFWRRLAKGALKGAETFIEESSI